MSQNKNNLPNNMYFCRAIVLEILVRLGHCVTVPSCVQDAPRRVLQHFFTLILCFSALYRSSTPVRVLIRHLLREIQPYPAGLQHGIR